MLEAMRTCFFRNMSLTLEKLECKQIKIALSGGVDSMVLLHLAHQYAMASNVPLAAVHVNHNLHVEADQWAHFCKTSCQKLNIALTIIKVNVAKKASKEAAARQARYAVFEQEMQAGTLLLLAHHRDDQVETVLFRLLRGAGLKGLSGMPALRPLGTGFLYRPLLSVSRKVIVNYALKHQLKWIEDPSNTEEVYERNWLRHKVVPLLVSRWPKANEQINKASQHLKASYQLLNLYVQEDLHQLFPTRLHFNDQALGAHITLAEPLWSRWGKSRQVAVLQCWIEMLSLPPLSEAALEQLFLQFVLARSDAQPVFKYCQGTFRRFRNRLYFLSADNALFDQLARQAIVTFKEAPQALLTAYGFELSPEVAPERLSISLGLPPKVRVLHKAHHHQAKNVYQEGDIPPWLRASLPVLFYNDALIMLMGFIFKEPSSIFAKDLIKECS